MTTRRTKVMIFATCAAWVAVASACIVSFGVVRGGLLGVWGVSIIAIGAAGLRHGARSWIRAREAGTDAYGETVLDVHAERELQTV